MRQVTLSPNPFDLSHYLSSGLNENCFKGISSINMSWEHLQIEILPIATFSFQKNRSSLQNYYFGRFFKIIYLRSQESE